MPNEEGEMPDASQVAIRYVDVGAEVDVRMVLRTLAYADDELISPISLAGRCEKGAALLADSPARAQERGRWCWRCDTTEIGRSEFLRRSCVAGAACWEGRGGRVVHVDGSVPSPECSLVDVVTQLAWESKQWALLLLMHMGT